MIKVAPSLLSADFAHLESEIRRVEKSQAEWLHFDVMDGHFVPNISFGSKVLKDVRKITDLFLDVHLMIEEPLKYAIDFAKAGADLITFHYEVFDELDACINAIEEIRKLGVKVGLSIKPKTDVEIVLPLLKHLDLVLVMSVEPGFGGQEFMTSALDKIDTLKKHIKHNKLNCLVEVDGGINDKTGKLCIDKGVDVLVAGSYLFGHDDFDERVKGLRC